MGGEAAQIRSPHLELQATNWQKATESPCGRGRIEIKDALLSANITLFKNQKKRKVEQQTDPSKKKRKRKRGSQSAWVGAAWRYTGDKISRSFNAVAAHTARGNSRRLSKIQSNPNGCSKKRGWRG